MSKPWFGPKRIGYGISPTSVEGWITVAIYFLALAIAFPVVRGLGAPLWLIPVMVAALTLALTVLVAVKYDGQLWKWRWGGQ